MISLHELLRGTGISLNGENSSDLYFHEHSIIVYFPYGLNSFDPLHRLDERLFQTFGEGEIGIYDGHEVAGDQSHGFLYFYGANALQVFRMIRPILKDTSFMDGAKATLRFGPEKENPLYMDVVL